MSKQEGKCNWCGRATDRTLEMNTVHLYMCSTKCDLDYAQAVNDGKIAIPQPSFLTRLKSGVFTLILAGAGLMFVSVLLGGAWDSIFKKVDHSNDIIDIMRSNPEVKNKILGAVAKTQQHESSISENVIPDTQTEKDPWEMILQFKDINGLSTFLCIPHSDGTSIWNCKIKEMGQEPFTFSCIGREYGDTLKVYFNSVSDGAWYGSQISKDVPIIMIIKKGNDSYSLVAYQLKDYLSGDNVQMSRISEAEYITAVESEQ